MTHKSIKRFQVSGTIKDDAYMIQARSTYINVLMSEMRQKGYVPLLDVDPAWSLKMNNEKYDFLLTIHGVYVGKKRSKEIYGIIGQKEVMME